MTRCWIIASLTMMISSWQSPAMFAQDSPAVTFQLEPESRLWLEGSSTIGDFTCTTNRIEGSAEFRSDSIMNGDSSQAAELDSKVRVSIPVKNLDCGNSAMNEDMINAMKADSFPSIQYELVESRLLPDSVTADSLRRVNIFGTLTLAGITQSVSMLITIREVSTTRFQVIGSTPLSMHDFDITPPTTLWGLIKANDKLVVNFDLIVTRKPSESQNNE